MGFIQCIALESPALDLDITLFIQFGLFLLVMLALRKYVIIPYFRAYDERESLTTGAKEEAAVVQKKADELKDAYNEERQKAYAKAESERREAVQIANIKASKMLEETRQSVQHDIEERQQAFDSQMSEARAHADREIQAISQQIANKLLV